MNIYDIAHKAGVSIATVSRVLNNSNTVSGKTRQRVLQIIDEENYRPNAFARGLSTDSAKLAGVLCTDVSDAFFAKAVSLLQRLLNKKDYTMLLGCTGDSAEGIKKQLDFMLEKKVDAIFLIGSVFCTEENSKSIENASLTVPLITVNAQLNTQNSYSVYCDDFEATFNTVIALNNKGYQKIIYIYDAVTPSALAKLKGFKEGILNLGIPFSEDLIFKEEKTINGGKNAIKQALSKGITPQAVITSEDILAVGAIKQMCELGLKPVVVGYNNSSVCECSTPTLTSINNRLEEMCKKAIDIMTKLLSGEITDKKYKFTAELILRESFKGED